MKYIQIALTALIICFSVFVSYYAYTATCGQIKSGSQTVGLSDKALNSVANLKINVPR